MDNFEFDWRSNLRANLVLWPRPSANVAALLSKHGQPYDENAFLASIPRSESEKTPRNTRTVRNTFEVLHLAGLAFRTYGESDQLLLTNLGILCAQFFGIGKHPRLANEENIALLARHYALGLACVAEYRTIWQLMIECDFCLSNEELNRALAAIRTPADIKHTATMVLKSREAGDPTVIGPRLYMDSEFNDEEKRPDQRKAMNPLFLLAGGGGILINNEENRSLQPWAFPLLRDALRVPQEIFLQSNNNVSQIIDSASCAPRSYFMHHTDD